MNPDDFLGKLNEDEQAKRLEQDKADQIGAVNQSGDKVVEALKGHTNELTGSIHDLLMATLVSKDPKIAETAKNLAALLGEIKNATKDIKGTNLGPLGDSLSELQKTLQTVPGQIEAAHQATDPNPLLKEIATTLGKKNFNPNVNVKAPSVDLSSLTKILTDIKTAISNEKETTDTSRLEDLTQSVASAVSEVKDAITALRFPVANYVLPFKDSTGKDVQVQLDASGNVPTSSAAGTSDINLKQVNGQTVNVGIGAAGTGTQRVSVSTDSIVGVQGTKTNNNAAPGATNIGVLSAVANASGPSFTEGNLVALSTDLSGNLRVNATVSGGSGTSALDNSAFTAGTTSGTPAMGFYHSTIDTVTDGRSAVIGMTSKRGMFVNLQNASGAEIGTSGAPLQVSLANTAANSTAVKVDGSAVTQPVSGTVTANIGTTNGLALDATLTSGNEQVQGNVASGATDSGNPVKVGGRNNTTKPTLTDGQRGDLQLDTRGILATQTFGGGQATNAVITRADNVDAVATSATAGSNLAVINRNTVFNGTTWDRMSGDTTGINVKAIVGALPAGSNSIGAVTYATTGSGTATGALRVEVANNGTGVVGLNTGTNSIGKISDITTSVVPGTGATNLGKAEDSAAVDGDTGVFVLYRRNDAAATAQTGTNGDYSAGSVDANGTLFVRQAPSNTPTLANVAASVTSVTALAANTSRRNFIIYNDSASDCYIKYGTTASTTSFTYYLPSLGTLQDEFYAGRIDAIHVSATGNLRVTEVTV